MDELELYRSPLGDQVYDLLKSAILDGDFAPGQRLSPLLIKRRPTVVVNSEYT